MRWEGLFEEQKIRDLGGGWWEWAGQGALAYSHASMETSSARSPSLLCCEGWCQTARDGSTPSGLGLSLLCQEQDPVASALTCSLWACTRQVLLAAWWLQPERCGKASVDRHRDGRGAEGRANVSLCRYRQSNAWTMGSSLAAAEISVAE